MKDLKTTLFENYREIVGCYEVACRDYISKINSTGENPARVDNREVLRWENKRLALLDVITQAGLMTEYQLWDLEQEEAAI